MEPKPRDLNPWDSSHVSHPGAAVMFQPGTLALFLIRIQPLVFERGSLLARKTFFSKPSQESVKKPDP
jgi:hypothetical protein